jgi:hypothetical protein
MNLEERLDVLEGRAQIPDAQPTTPNIKGWEPGIVWDGSSGTITTSPSSEEPDPAIWAELIRDWGLDPERTEIVPGTIQVRGWDANMGGEIVRLKYYRATLRPRTASDVVTAAHMEELYKEARKSKRKKNPPKDGESTLIVALSDWQVGNRDGGGVESQAKAIADLVESIPQRVSDVRRMGHKIGTIAVLGMGDLGEGTCGHYPTQQFRIELDRRDQLKLVRRGIRDIIMGIAPLAPQIMVAAVPGNHGENRQNGQSITSVHDNDDVAVFEQVAEILSINPTDYGHIGWRLSRDEIALAIELSGQIVALTHGHASKGFGGGAAGATGTMWKWWERHSMGRVNPGLAAAHYLISGHFHHFNIKEQESRTLIICPSITPVGEYFQDSAGVKTRSGTLSLVITPDGWQEMTLL